MRIRVLFYAGMRNMSEIGGSIKIMKVITKEGDETNPGQKTGR